MLKKLVPVIMISLLVLILLGIKYYPEIKSMVNDDRGIQTFQDSKQSAEKNQPQKDKDDSTQNDTEHKDTTKPDTFLLS